MWLQGGGDGCRSWGGRRNFQNRNKLARRQSFFHLIPKAYLSAHIHYTRARFQETNAKGYNFAVFQLTRRKHSFGLLLMDFRCEA